MKLFIPRLIIELGFLTFALIILAKVYFILVARIRK